MRIDALAARAHDAQGARVIVASEHVVLDEPEAFRVKTIDGVATRILRFEPGADSSVMGVQIHDFWEEVYILEGSFVDLTVGI